VSTEDHYADASIIVDTILILTDGFFFAVSFRSKRKSRSSRRGSPRLRRRLKNSGRRSREEFGCPYFLEPTPLGCLWNQVFFHSRKKAAPFFCLCTIFDFTSCSTTHEDRPRNYTGSPVSFVNKSPSNFCSRRITMEIEYVQTPRTVPIPKSHDTKSGTRPSFAVGRSD